MLLIKLRENSKGLRKHLRLLTIIILTAVAVFFTLGESAFAKRWKKKAGELDPVNVFIEWNTTDEDQGIQFFWDSDGFTRMIVFNESGKKVLDIETKNSVKDQGLTEVAIESVEPEESEQTLDEFFERFPAGTYKFWGRSVDKGWLYGEADFTHDLVDPVEIDLSEWPTIMWGPEEDGVEDDGVEDDGVEVVGYEVVVELVIKEVIEDGEDSDEGEERVFKQTTTLPEFVEQLTISPEFVRLIGFYEGSDEWDVEELKVEILADEESGNRTITEVPVCLGEEGNICPDEED
jgi:hypothetical protein